MSDKEEVNGVVSEIDSMLASFGQPTNEEPKEVEEIKEEVKEEKEEVEEIVNDNEDVVDDKKPDDEDILKDESKEDPDEKDKVIEDLRAKLAEKEVVPEKEEVKEEIKEEELTFENQDFVGDQDIDEILGDKDGINKLLNAVYTRGVTDSRKVVGEHVLRDIPNIVRTNVSLITEMAKARDEFFDTNPDLTPFKKVVATVFEEVASKNPDKGYKEVLVEVGKEARNRLDLHKKAAEKVSEEKTPKLHNKKGTRTSKEQPNTTPLEDELSDMNNVMRR